MNTKINIEVELQGTLYKERGEVFVENFKVIYKNDNITGKLSGEELQALENEFLETYAEDYEDAKYEFNPED